MQTQAMIPNRFSRLLSGFSTLPEIPASSSRISTGEEAEEDSSCAITAELSDELSSELSELPGSVKASGAGVGVAGLGVAVGWAEDAGSVSYTHLTLPTICSV